MSDNRQIRRDSAQLTELATKSAEMQAAIATLTQIVRKSLDQTTSTPDNGAKHFTLDEVTAKFGLAFGAEGSIIVTKTSLTASLEVEVKFSR